MAAPSVIDINTYTQLRELMGDDYMVEVIDAYLTETADLIAQLKDALLQGNSSRFDRLAHSIKSSSASLGAITFSTQARELELIGKSRDLSQAGPLVAGLAQDFEDVVARLKELKDEP